MVLGVSRSSVESGTKFGTKSGWQFIESFPLTRTRMRGPESRRRRSGARTGRHGRSAAAQGSSDAIGRSFALVGSSRCSSLGQRGSEDRLRRHPVVQITVTIMNPGENCRRDEPEGHPACRRGESSACYRRPTLLPGPKGQSSGTADRQDRLRCRHSHIWRVHACWSGFSADCAVRTEKNDLIKTSSRAGIPADPAVAIGGDNAPPGVEVGDPQRGAAADRDQSAALSRPPKSLESRHWLTS